MARITRFDHASFTVADIDRTVAFWRDVMGLDLDDLSPRTQPWLGAVVGRPGATCRIAHMTGHGCHMEFIAYDEGFGGENVFGPATRPGAAHVAFYTDDINGMAERIVAAGGSLMGEITFCAAEGHNRDCLAAYACDPEGIIIDLIEDLPAGTQTR
jgi:catechol 2,3-dioxygenase-like lactoylglutathione lyase family enzyme